MHLQTAFADPHVGQRPPQDDRQCPVATSLCDRVLSLPMHPYITVDEIDTVCGVIRQALQ